LERNEVNVAYMRDHKRFKGPLLAILLGPAWPQPLGLL